MFIGRVNEKTYCQPGAADSQVHGQVSVDYFDNCDAYDSSCGVVEVSEEVPDDNVIQIYRHSWTCECGGKYFKIVSHDTDPKTPGKLLCVDCECTIERLKIVEVE